MTTVMTEQLQEEILKELMKREETPIGQKKTTLTSICEIYSITRYQLDKIRKILFILNKENKEEPEEKKENRKITGELSEEDKQIFDDLIAKGATKKHICYTLDLTYYELKNLMKIGKLRQKKLSKGQLETK
jgi:hypothetical protein